jgi:hypothetical protein
VTRREHLDAMCAALEAKLAAAPVRTARRLLRPQLRWVEQRPDDPELAHRLGVVTLVEACRDEHLASLDADDGLTVLAIDWREVVERACERARIEPAVPRCGRCGARLTRRREPRCKRCGLPGRGDS